MADLPKIKDGSPSWLLYAHMGQFFRALDLFSDDFREWLRVDPLSLDDVALGAALSIHQDIERPYIREDIEKHREDSKGPQPANEA